VSCSVPAIRCGSTSAGLRSPIYWSCATLSGTCSPSAGSRGPADLVIEIASEGDPGFDIREKLPRYKQAGIEEIWLIDPFQRTLQAHSRREGDYEVLTLPTGRLASQVLPGFWLDVAWLWQEPLPSALACLERVSPR
jgi:hypothetical protein